MMAEVNARPLQLANLLENVPVIWRQQEVWLQGLAPRNS